MQIQYEEYEVANGCEGITVRLCRPDKILHLPDQCLLLSFANDRHTSLGIPPYALAAETFLQKGHPVLSFNLPNHGSNINHYGEGIAGFRNAFVAGVDPFQLFVEQGQLVIDWCIDQGLATAGQIAVCGTSRGGYMALRLLAADTRISAGAGFAPVTDWRDLSEFEREIDREDLACLRLSSFAVDLASRPVFIAIGHHDQRVNTARCCELYLDILQSKQTAGYDTATLDFYITDDPGHSCNPTWYHKGADFLLNAMENHVNLTTDEAKNS
jgi:dienelactone hydrolase